MPFAGDRQARSGAGAVRFVELTVESSTAVAAIAVRLDEIAYFLAAVREGRCGPVDCGLLVLKSGQRLDVLEDFELFTEVLREAGGSLSSIEPTLSREVDSQSSLATPPDPSRMTTSP
jgi:hypothetical protein